MHFKISFLLFFPILFTFISCEVPNPLIKGPAEFPYQWSEGVEWEYDSLNQMYQTQSQTLALSWAVREMVDGDFISMRILETDGGLGIGMDGSVDNDPQVWFGWDAETEALKVEIGWINESYPLARADLPLTLRLEKQQNRVLLWYATHGKTLKLIREHEFEARGIMQTGPHSRNARLSKVDNVRFSRTGPDASEKIDRARISSRLEILDLKSLKRSIVYAADEHFEAPNWTRDGHALIFNQDGELYQIPVAGGAISQINTGGLDRLNNDHGISFDGRQLAISHHASENDGQSLIYTLPITGGAPRLITPKGPSYWHGWSPDGQSLVYCAERNGQYDVYRIASDGAGEEVQLTDTKTLDDGPEYSPDGQYIYFNSARTGTMQIWRMRPDGSEERQMTFDTSQDWFAHPSPDGREMVFISYSSDIPAEDHPPLKRVMIRKMPAEGGEPQVVAHVYGGQGTLNVPSWSPDGTKLAFVSYN
ncbi:MAG: biopolymer transporter TolR [Bacteroidota bacterium]